MAHFGQGLGLDVVAQQKLGDRTEHFFGFVAVVTVNHLFAHGSACAGGQLGVHRQQGVAVVGAEELVMRGQVGQHFFGVSTAIHSQ